MKKILIILLSTYSIVANAQWQQLGNDIDGISSTDKAGNSTAISADGKTIVVALYSNCDTYFIGGLVKVYTYNGTSWIQKGQDLLPQYQLDFFGNSVSISADGTTIAIGAPNIPFGGLPGYVNVYNWNGSSWTPMGIQINGEAAGDAFGTSVSLSADGFTLAVGATHNDNNATDAGHVRVFSWNGFNWSQMGNDIDGAAKDDFTGSSVSLNSDGLTLVVGSPGYDVPAASTKVDAGNVKIYTWNGNSWAQKGQDINGDFPTDYFGESTQIDDNGTTIIVGASHYFGWNGCAKVFSWNGTQWALKGNIISGTISSFLGRSVDISADGNTIAIGETMEYDTAATVGGRVRIYKWNNSNWIQKGGNINGEAIKDLCGSSVSLSYSGDTIVVGAVNNNGGFGHARVFYDLVSSINEYSSIELNIFPNPALNYFTVDINSESDLIGSRLKITNSLGQIIYSNDLNILSTTIDVSNLAPALYNISIENNNYIITKKLQIIK